MCLRIRFTLCDWYVAFNFCYCNIHDHTYSNDSNQFWRSSKQKKNLFYISTWNTITFVCWCILFPFIHYAYFFQWFTIKSSQITYKQSHKTICVEILCVYSIFFCVFFLYYTISVLQNWQFYCLSDHIFFTTLTFKSEYPQPINQCYLAFPFVFFFGWPLGNISLGW